MFNTNKKLIIKNPNDREDAIPTIDEMVQDTLFQLASMLESEIAKPQEDMLWPRKWHVQLSNGNNELVVAKLDVQKFADVRNSGEEVSKFRGVEADDVEIETDEDEKGETVTYSIESTPCLYLDMGYREDKEDGIIASRALLVGEIKHETVKAEN